jgi:hypothetical protein
MQIKTFYEIVPLKNSPGDAQLFVHLRVNDEPAGGGTVVLSGNQADIEAFVAGTIDFAEIRKRWGFDPQVYSVRASYTGEVDPSLDKAIERLMGRAPVSTGYARPSDIRDLVFEFGCASQAMKAVHKLTLINVEAKGYEGPLNVIGKTAKLI